MSLMQTGGGGNFEVAMHDLAQVKEADGGENLTHDLQKLSRGIRREEYRGDIENRNAVPIEGGTQARTFTVSASL